VIAALTYLLLPFAVLAHAAGRALGEGRRSDRFLLLSPDLFRLDLASFASLTALLALAATLCALGALALWLAAPLAVGGEAVLGPAFGGELAAALSLLAMGGGGGAVGWFGRDCGAGGGGAGGMDWGVGEEVRRVRGGGG
jgi:hypothetical protein